MNCLLLSIILRGRNYNFAHLIGNRLRGLQWLVQSHTAGQWGSPGWNPKCDGPGRPCSLPGSSVSQPGGRVGCTALNLVPHLWLVETAPFFLPFRLELPFLPAGKPCLSCGVSLTLYQGLSLKAPDTALVIPRCWRCWRWSSHSHAPVWECRLPLHPSRNLPSFKPESNLSKKASVCYPPPPLRPRRRLLGSGLHSAYGAEKVLGSFAFPH